MIIIRLFKTLMQTQHLKYRMQWVKHMQVGNTDYQTREIFHYVDNSLQSLKVPYMEQRLIILVC